MANSNKAFLPHWKGRDPPREKSNGHIQPVKGAKSLPAKSTPLLQSQPQPHPQLHKWATTTSHAPYPLPKNSCQPQFQKVPTFWNIHHHLQYPPPPPVPQTLTADLDPSLTELEEICRQLENSWQEDIECKNLLRAAPELKEEKVTIPPNNSTKTRQLKCSGKTGNSTHTLTHPKARPQKVASRYEEQMDSKDWNQRQQILLNTTCHMPAMALHPLPLILPLHSGTQVALIPSTYDGSQSHSSKDWGGVLMWSITLLFC